MDSTVLNNLDNNASQEKQWFVIRTASRAEKAVASRLNELARLGIEIEADALIQRIEKKTSKNKRIVEQPLISQYIFVSCSTEVLKRHVLFHAGVVKVLLRAGMSPLQPNCYAVVKEHELDMVRQFAQNSTVEVQLEEVFKAGTKVRVVSGAFAGIEGVVSSLRTKKSRVRINIAELGSIPLDIETSLLERI